MVVFNTSVVAKISLPPLVVPMVNLYPVAVAEAFQDILVSKATFVAILSGAVNVVHVGGSVFGAAPVLKLSSTQPVASPTSL